MRSLVVISEAVLLNFISGDSPLCVIHQAPEPINKRRAGMEKSAVFKLIVNSVLSSDLSSDSRTLTDFLSVSFTSFKAVK